MFGKAVSMTEPVLMKFKCKQCGKFFGSYVHSFVSRYRKYDSATDIFIEKITIKNEFGWFYMSDVVLQEGEILSYWFNDAIEAKRSCNKCNQGIPLETFFS